MHYLIIEFSDSSSTEIRNSLPKSITNQLNAHNCQKKKKKERKEKRKKKEKKKKKKKEKVDSLHVPVIKLYCRSS